MKHFLTLLPLILLTQAAFSSEESREEEDNLLRDGFAIFTDESQPLFSESALNEAQKFFREKATVDCDHPIYGRRFSYSYIVFIELEKVDEGWALTNAATNKAALQFPNDDSADISWERYWPAIKIAEEMLWLIDDTLLGTRVAIELYYVDELRKGVEESEKELAEQQNIMAISFGRPKLGWHVDRFGMAPHEQYDLLVFTLLNCHGVQEHFLELGIANTEDFLPPSSIGKWLKKEAEPQIIAQIPAKKFATYVINQSFKPIIVHGREAYETVLTNGPIDETLNNGDNYTSIPGWEAWHHNINSPDYEPPRREFVVGRFLVHHD